MTYFMGSRAILIAGPTASGKSAVALALAEALAARGGAVIVNADSQQLYRDLRVLTARPSVADEARVPHRLYGIRDAAERCSAAAWCELARSAIAEAEGTGRVPIVVGGTGLYFRALTEGLSAIPAIPAAVRTAARARLAAIGPAALHRELAARDPVTAQRLEPGDRQRIVRAVEVIEATGRPLSAWQASGARSRGLAPQLALVLAPERAALHRRIAARFEAMLDNGAGDEVRALLARGLDPTLPAMKAVGVEALRAYLAGELDRAAAIAAGQAATRQYAKRQMTWFRHQMPGWRAIDAQQTERIVHEIFSFIC
jgi:tRNA dimethylallyltransferase